MKDTKKSKADRPSKYRAEICDRVKELMKDGLSLHEVAKEIGVAYWTLNKWREEKKKFSKAVEHGIALSRAWWEKVGRDNLSNKSFNTNVYQANMRNRFGWDQKHQLQIDTTVRSGIMIMPASANLDALRAAAAKRCLPVDHEENVLPFNEEEDGDQEDERHTSKIDF